MRRLLLSASLGAVGCLCAYAQVPSASHDTSNVPQIPTGQTYKNFQFPLYQNGVLNATLAAISAKGITVNRAETTDLKIDLYTNGKVTTTISSPKADLYVAERVMRTKNTVLVERADLEAKSQVCDFDLINKRYLMRQNVHVLLKNFDVGATAKGPTPAASASGTATPTHPAPTAGDEMVPESGAPSSSLGGSSSDVPGASAVTNAAPLQPAAPATP